MKTSHTSIFAALLVATSAFGGASAAFAANSGDYYVGVSEAPVYQSVTVERTGAAVVAPEVRSGGDGEYYAGISRDPIDRLTTGSITSGSVSNAVRGGATPFTPNGGEGQYYQGLNRR